MWKTIRKYFRWRHQGAHAAQFGPVTRWDGQSLPDALRDLIADDEEDGDAR